MRRPQKSELIRSESFQSAPASNTTTFLPAFAITAAYTEPEAPDPTTTTSTFSFAMSPPLGRHDVRHVGNAQRVVAGHGAVNDIHRIEAQHGVDEATARSLPTLDLVLTHVTDEIALLGFSELGEATTAVERLAGAIDRAQRRAIEICIRRAHIEDASFEQCFLGRDRNLLIYEVRYPRLARAGDQGFAQRVECGRLL